MVTIKSTIPYMEHFGVMTICRMWFQSNPLKRLTHLCHHPLKTKKTSRFGSSNPLGPPGSWKSNFAFCGAGSTHLPWLRRCQLIPNMGSVPQSQGETKQMKFPASLSLSEIGHCISSFCPGFHVGFQGAHWFHLFLVKIGNSTG